MIDIVTRPPWLYRVLFPGAIWRILDGNESHTVYLTFDDGPIPEVTPWVLDLLDQYGFKATFFMVGENVKRHPELVEEVLRRGHTIGNHTMHHLRGSKVTTRTYLRDILEADHIVPSNLFRPPHGFMRPMQIAALRRKYTIVMHDHVTRDYDKSLPPEYIIRQFKKKVRPGAVIVFHDSLKAWPNLRLTLPACLAWLHSQGYTSKCIPVSSQPHLAQ